MRLHKQRRILQSFPIYSFLLAIYKEYPPQPGQRGPHKGDALSAVRLAQHARADQAPPRALPRRQGGRRQLGRTDQQAKQQHGQQHTDNALHGKTLLHNVTA